MSEAKTELSNGETKKDNDNEKESAPDSVKEDVSEPSPSEDDSNESDNVKKKEDEEGSSEKINGDADKGDNSNKYTFVREARNRVKLYVLCEQRIWDDRGTGHVACLPLPDQPGFHAIIVRLEANGLVI